MISLPRKQRRRTTLPRSRRARCRSSPPAAGSRRPDRARGEALRGGGAGVRQGQPTGSAHSALHGSGAERRGRHRARRGDGHQGGDVQSAQLQLRICPSQGREDAGHLQLTPSSRVRWPVRRSPDSGHMLYFQVPASRFHPSCGSGGTGRRASLRSLWPQGRGGSNPLFRTNRQEAQ